MHRVAILLAAGLGVCLAADPNPTAVLAQVRDRIVASLRRMPNYTCVETITREYYKPNTVQPPKSCDELSAQKRWASYKLEHTALDRLRLDVAVVPDREIYSWAGAVEFESRDPSEIIGGGPIGTGPFGAFLMAIFGTQSAGFAYVGPTTQNGRALFEFTYRVPRENSHYQIRVPEGWIVAAYDGTILIDPETSDLVQLSIRTEELPRATDSCETRTRMEYQRVTIGGSDVLLPRETRQRFILRNGIEAQNTYAFSACRQYSGESSLHFAGEDEGAPGPGHSAARSASGPLTPLPLDLPVALEFAAPVDTWKASGGDLIPMRLAKPILDSARHVLVPAGAAIEARLIRVQRYFTKPERSTLVVKPETVEHNGVRMPFPVLPGPQDTTRWLETGFHTHGVSMGEIPMPNEIKFGILHFVGDHAVVPKGYRTNWFTAALPESPE
jgi:hypothetical protein